MKSLLPAQGAAIEKLVAAGRLESVAPDPDRAQRFVSQAAEAVAEVGNLTRPRNAYNLAYDACHDVARFDQLRRARNASRYEARSPGEQQAHLAADTARALITAAALQGLTT